MGQGRNCMKHQNSEKGLPPSTYKNRCSVKINPTSEDCFDSDFIRPDFQFDPVLQLKGQLGHKLVEYPTSTHLERPSMSRRLRLLRVTEMQMQHEMCFFQNDPTPLLNTHSGFLKRNGRRTMTGEISRDAGRRGLPP